MLLEENRVFSGTGGVSANNRSQGFRPAFYDFETERIYLSRFADGRPAPMHLIGGLPPEVVNPGRSSDIGTAIKQSLISGFERLGKFYTREEAAAAVEYLFI
jgi:hypothetical protein